MSMQEKFEKDFAEDLEPIEELYLRHARRFHTATRVKAWLPKAEAEAKRDMLVELISDSTAVRDGIAGYINAEKLAENIEDEIDKLNIEIGKGNEKAKG